MKCVINLYVGFYGIDSVNFRSVQVVDTFSRRAINYVIGWMFVCPSGKETVLFGNFENCVDFKEFMWEDFYALSILECFRKVSRIYRGDGSGGIKINGLVISSYGTWCACAIGARIKEGSIVGDVIEN